MKGLVLIALVALLACPGALAQVAVSKVAVGGSFACALTTLGGVKCWGQNAAGQLGDGTRTNRSVPADVVGLATGVRDIASGDAHTCALMVNGGVKCWGYNFQGQVGIGRDGNDMLAVLVPTDVVGLTSGVAAIAVGYSNSFAITTAGALKSWGIDYAGGSGIGLFGHATPFDIPGLASGVASVATTGLNTCVLMTGGAVKCWGSSATTAPTRMPTDVTGLPSGIVAISAFCALTSAGTVHCWNEDRQPVTMPADYASGVASFSPGAPGCFVTVVGVAKCWGYNFYGAVGDGTTTDRSSPVNVLNVGTGVAFIATNRTTGACAVTALGNVMCWGWNVFGQVGDGTTAQRSAPTGVVGLSSRVAQAGAIPATGWWWNPTEPGRGYSIESQGSRLFFAAYQYMPNGRATWHIAAGTTSLGGSMFSGQLEAYSRGQTLDGAWRAPNPVQYVGSITLAFDDATHGTLAWPGGLVAIERFNIVPNGLNLPAPANQPEAGWWWNPTESGRGFFLEWQGGQLFMAGYMFDDAGEPVWYLTSDNMNQQSYVNTWWRYANGSTLWNGYRPALQVSNRVGPVTIQFQGPDTAIMTLPGGRTTAITRYRF